MEVNSLLGEKLRNGEKGNRKDIKYDLVKWVLYANTGFYLVASDKF